MYSAALFIAAFSAAGTSEPKVVGIGDVLINIESDRRENVDLAVTALLIARTIYLVDKLELPSGSTLAWSETDKGYCSAGKGYIQRSGAESSVCLLDDDGDGKFDRLAGVGIVRPIKLKTPIPYTRKVGPFVTPARVSKRIIYLGGTPTEARFSYREFTDSGFARPAFTEDLTVPIHEYPTAASLKGVRFTILKQASDGLTVEMMAPD